MLRHDAAPHEPEVRDPPPGRIARPVLLHRSDVNCGVTYRFRHREFQEWLVRNPVPTQLRC
jgi:hypothetical protein